MNIGNGENKLVSRAGNKLAMAVYGFRYDFRDKIVLDIGASTGGFTGLALERGAKRVIAIEKGTKQMKAPLRFDQRVELYEKTDIFQVITEARLARRGMSEELKKKTKIVVIPNVEVILADVSFISLRKVLKYAQISLACSRTDFLVMLKPQFEAKPEELVRGVVKNEKIRRRIIKDFEFWLREEGFLIIGKKDNELKGRSGNRERFYFLKLGRDRDRGGKRRK